MNRPTFWIGYFVAGGAGAAIAATMGAGPFLATGVAAGAMFTWTAVAVLWEYRR